jgi:hypothetical protein
MSDKISYIKNFPKTLSILDPTLKGKWGKMNAQQMVEHMSFAFRWANGRSQTKPAYSPEITQKSYQFMMTEKPFRENTPNQLISDEPYAWKHAKMSDAIAELQSEIDHFFEVYSGKPELRMINPFFGNLNFEEQVQLLHKHAVHHAKQFGLGE